MPTILSSRMQLCNSALSRQYQTFPRQSTRTLTCPLPDQLARKPSSRSKQRQKALHHALLILCTVKTPTQLASTLMPYLIVATPATDIAQGFVCKCIMFSFLSPSTAAKPKWHSIKTYTSSRCLLSSTNRHVHTIFHEN